MFFSDLTAEEFQNNPELRALLNEYKEVRKTGGEMKWGTNGKTVQGRVKATAAQDWDWYRQAAAAKPFSGPPSSWGPPEFRSPQQKVIIAVTKVIEDYFKIEAGGLNDAGLPATTGQTNIRLSGNSLRPDFLLSGKYDATVAEALRPRLEAAVRMALILPPDSPVKVLMNGHFATPENPRIAVEVGPHLKGNPLVPEGRVAPKFNAYGKDGIPAIFIASGPET